MPKSVALISHEAIKRSLKSKFKLILSENRILVETINGYVRKAEKVYKEMESTDDVTPKQFSKAMEKLERAYSACVRLIMVASDLFGESYPHLTSDSLSWESHCSPICDRFSKKGDMDGTKVRDLGPSSCDSETSIYSSESSTTITDSNRARKVSKIKLTHRRSKSSDVRVNELTKVKTKLHSSSQRNQTIELADTSMADATNGTSERLFVRPGSSSDFDHLIELQRFLHGLEREKLQTDHPSPCVAPEKQLMSYKLQKAKATTVIQSDAEQKQASPEESPSQSLSHRLKILKNAIEHFKDRSLGDERVTQALNEIRELVLKNREPKEVGANDIIPDVEPKEGLTSQTSLASESISFETHQNEEEKDCKDKREICHDAHEKNVSSIKRKQSPPVTGKSQPGNIDDKTIQNSPLVSEWSQKTLHIQQQTPSQQRNQEQNTEQMDVSITQAAVSPLLSPQVSDDNKDDINQIIVNKIVDMVSAKLAPRLQMKNSERQLHTQNTPESDEIEVKDAFPKHMLSPQFYVCQEIPFTQNQQQGNCCGSYNRLLPLHRNRYQQQHGQRQDSQKLHHQKQKMVSFVEDYECDLPYNTWNAKPQNEVRTFVPDSSPSSHTPSPFLFSDCEEPQAFHSHKSAKLSSPHNKRSLHSIQIPQTAQNYMEHHHYQKAPILHRKSQEHEEINMTDIDADKEEDQSEQANDSDTEVVKEQSQYQPQNTHSKLSPSHQSITWRSRSVPRSPSFLETEYRTMHLSQRGQQQALHKTDSFLHKLSARSPSVDNQQKSLKDSLRKEWFSPFQQATNFSPHDGSNLHPSEGDAANRDHFRHVKMSNELRQGDNHIEKSNSADQNKEGSPNAVVTQSQPYTETIRQFPTKAPRSSTPQSQSQHPNNSHNISGGQCGYPRLSNNDTLFQNSESSCEGSPIFGQDDRLQQDNISTGSNQMDAGVKDQTLGRAEVVCIDATQLHADASRTVTLSNLPLDMEEKELLNIFKKYGQVTKIYYIKDRNTGVFQGRAYGKFSKASEAYQAAQDLQNLIIDGHEISVQLYINTP